MQAPVLLYDAECGMCRLFAHAASFRIRTAPLQDAACRSLLEPHMGAGYMESFHVVTGKGEVLSDGVAVWETVALVLGRWTLLARALPFADAAVERLYRFMAGNRACAVTAPSGLPRCGRRGSPSGRP